MNHASRWFVRTIPALLVIGATCCGPTRTAEPAEPDYSAVLPRIPPKSPDEALTSFRLRPGFRIELVAAEPLIRDPVAIDFDEDGRLYVVEFVEYNQYANPAAMPRGAVKRLEDLDADGRYETAHDFVDELEMPVAVACYDGGVFVGATPDILYFKDTDGDGRADVREAVFTGFARDHAGEGMLNSFRWGLDNRFHVCTNIAGGDVRRADQPDTAAVSVRGQGFIFDPRTRRFELTSGGGQHGMTLDDWNRTFVCGNSEPTHMIMYDGRYVARNPYLRAPAAAINIAPGGKYTKLFRISENEPWRVLRTRLRKEGLVPGSDEGGEPSGFFTGATGVTVYRGDAWPQEYRGNIFVGEVSGNLVYRARLEPDGVGFVAPRADPDVEFLASSDNWFRPVQLANGPDGNLYVVDMYRELIEGAAFLPPEILRHLDVSSGVDRGRIYRIVRDDFIRPAPSRLSQATTPQLVALLEHPSGWRRDTASRLLYERQDSAAIAPLKALARSSQSAIGRTQALYALDGVGALEAELVLAALCDPVPEAREHALRLAECFASDPVIRLRCTEMAEDPDVRVRYQLAFTLGSFGGSAPVPSLAQIARRDGENPWIRMAILSSAVDCSGPLFSELAGDATFRETGAGRELLGALVEQIGAANRSADIAAVLQALESLPDSAAQTMRDLLARLAQAQPADARERLTADSGGKIGEMFASLMDDARRTATDAETDPRQRAQAVKTLALADFDDGRPLFEQLLQSQTPQPVQAAVLESLARFESAQVPEVILEAWPSLSPQLRATATETLFARHRWIRAVLDAVEGGRLLPADLDPARIALLQASGDAAVRNRAAALFASQQLGRRQSVVDDYQAALELEGDAARGKEVFRNSCGTCHRLQDVGQSIGADLSAIRDRGTAAVLLNILDPNREVKPQYLSYVLELQEGRVVTGMITTETANSVTLRRADGTSETVLRLDIETLRSTGLSFMPEGLETQIDHQAMADLLAFLNSIR